VTVYKSKWACLRALNAWAAEAHIENAARPPDPNSEWSLEGPHNGRDGTASYAVQFVTKNDVAFRRSTTEMSCKGKNMTKNFSALVSFDPPLPPLMGNERK
jgi:hypothetical protein